MYTHTHTRLIERGEPAAAAAAYRSVPGKQVVWACRVGQDASDSESNRLHVDIHLPVLLLSFILSIFHRFPYKGR